MCELLFAKTAFCEESGSLCFYILENDAVKIDSNIGKRQALQFFPVLET